MTKTYTAEVPSSIALPSDTDDQSRDYDVTIEFEWTAGTPEFIPPYNQPEDYDPGSGDEFHIVSGDDAPLRKEAIVEWLDENWQRPDFAAEDADRQYQEYRDDQMERRAHEEPDGASNDAPSDEEQPA